MVCKGHYRTRKIYASVLPNFQLGVSGFTLLPGSLDLLRMNSPIPASPSLPPPCSLCPRGMLTAGKDRQYFYHDLRAASVVVSQEGAAGM